MSENIDDWLSEGLGTPAPAAPATPAAPAPRPRTPPPPTSALFATARPTAPAKPVAPSPAQRIPTPSRGKGGLIRNQSTKVVTQTSNPVTNPRRPKGRVMDAPTAEEELRAENPAVAIPTLMTGMDVDANKPKQAPVQQQLPPAAQPVQRVVTGETTLKQMVEWAAENGGSWNIGNNNFVCTIRIRNTQVIPPASGSEG
jgi:hypothetical protein